MTKLGEITLNGKQISVFKPPHDDPDFPWVDVEELAKAFLPRAAARRMVSHSQRFGGDVRAVSTVRNGDRIATIFCHAMAQGLCGAIDQWKGFKPKDDDDTGPAHDTYCLAMGKFAADHWPLPFDQLIHAFHNPGGKFMKGINE
jgi:hypothetical protein